MANQSWDEWAAWGFGAAIAIGVWVCLLLVVIVVLRRLLRAIRRNKAKAHDDRDGLGSDRGE
ncbi:MAG: hypothetical protein ACYTGW_07825 [Planctomycetota bacterium]|jgi:flagellar biosynthesis/type III secretory pathway M-ring protein FliF/YscJ